MQFLKIVTIIETEFSFSKCRWP